jgi:D-alanyl-D-alanine carboxypeptidase/D-alanyl-D-alanine-endopeptidase (penicillin-binding protein 4)
VEAHDLDASGSRSKNGFRVRRRPLAVIVALLALAAPASTAAGPSEQTPLQRQLARALSVPHVQPARSAAVALDLSTGEVVFAQNGTRSLAPASNAKLPLTYAATVRLGPAFRISTDVLGDGGQDGTTWDGSLVLKGNGDPTLSRTDLRALAQQVREAGIRAVTGDVVGDESSYDARRMVAGWKASFFIQESPPLSALVVDRGRVGRFITRTPALAAATAFRDALRAAGIAVAGTVRLGRVEDWLQPIASVSSPTLAAMLRFMDRESDNFTAEMLLKQLGLVELDQGTSAAGASVVTQAMAQAGVPMTGVRIVDGSGLSRLDRLTANSLGGLLKVAWTDPVVRPVLLAALPVAGVNGTLEKRLRQPPARGRVLAKTGTTREASALSGYVKGRFAFAIVQNGYPVSYWWARRAQDRFALVLAAQ